MVAIAGVRNVRIEDINATYKELDKIKGKAVFQLFDSTKIAGWKHLYYSTVNALNARKTGTSVSKNLEIEILLYASAQDQISKAINMMGITTGTGNIALLVVAKKLEDIPNNIIQYLGKQDDSVLDLDKDKFIRLMEVYGITKEALKIFPGPKYKVLENLIVEKCALMPLSR
jgi:tRNA threonylcarbamoyladenosine modification (KEOPS) complex Cgi121 subunit